MVDKLKNIKLFKRKYLYLVMAFIVILAVGITFAWWQWSSEINASVNAKVCAPEIVFVGGTTINGHDLLPVRTKEEGLTKDINVNLNNTCDNDTAVLNLNLVLESFPSGLADASFKWSLYQVTTEEVNNEPIETLTYVNDGNFANKTQTDVISLATDLIVTENVSTYRLFIWIDATMDNPSSIGDNIFKFNIYGTGRDAIYREYVMKNPGMAQATTYFINSDISKETIESIDIVSFSKLPEDAIFVEDISSNSDDSIKLYYLEDTETNLKKVYLASSNGKIKLNTNMDYMFAGLTNVSTLDLSRLDTSNVTSMIGVFYDSSSLTSINISNWDTSNVTNMSKMFQSASGLTSLDVSNFDTSKVTTMASMFQNAGTSSLIINIDNFNTPKVTTMASMFQGCKASSINLSNFSNELLTNMSSMFQGCKASSINFNNFDTSNVTNMYALFMSCTNLFSVDLSEFITTNLTATRDMFQGCSNLASINMNNFSTENVNNMNGTFGGCKSLTRLDLSSFTSTSLPQVNGMFNGCSNLMYLNMNNFEFGNATRFGRQYNTFNKVPKSSEIIVKNCTQFNLFNTNVGTDYTNLHTIDGDYTCTA